MKRRKLLKAGIAATAATAAVTAPAVVRAQEKFRWKMTT